MLGRRKDDVQTARASESRVSLQPAEPHREPRLACQRSVVSSPKRARADWVDALYAMDRDPDGADFVSGSQS